MRTLVVAFEYPWPVNSGSRIRLLTAVQALARLGSVDLFAIVPADRTDFEDPDTSVISRSARVSVRPANLLATSIRHPFLPAEVPLRDRRAVNRSLATFMQGTYDLIWFVDIKAWVLAGVPKQARQVVDLVDLENEKIRARLSIPVVGAPHAHQSWRRWAARTWSRVEVLRWTRLYRRASRSVNVTVVCSALDADRIRSAGVDPVAVVANTYPRPREARGRDTVGSPPTVLFQGTMRYPPNADGAQWLAAEIAPLVHAEHADVHVRLVGLANPTMQTLDDPPAVTVVGQVEDIGSELGRADIVMVPVRFGSGTRLKILEAFAHRIPVISTTLGGEGLGARDDQHLLVADSAQAMAEAVSRLLNDPPLRRRLIQSAHQLYLDEFTDDRAFEQIAGVVSSVTER